MQVENAYDIIVVGAGPGGSSIAAILAQKGYHILIDKKQQAGGRMMTVRKDGFQYEMFPINGVPSRNSHFEKLLKLVGMESEVEIILPKSPGIMIYEDEKGIVREFDMGTSSINLLRALGIRLWYLPDIIDTIKVLKLMATIPADKIEELQDTSARDLLAKFPMPKGLLTYLLVSFGEGAFESTSDRTSAAEMIKVFQSAMKNGGGRYYKNGIGFVFEKLVEAVVELGGDAIFNTRVEKILVDNNQVTGIATVDGQEFHAPVVISNAGLRQTVLKLVGEEYFTLITSNG